MKIFRVVVEREGPVSKQDGTTVTDIRRESLWFAAGTIDEVWDAIKWLRDDVEATVMSIIEEVPAIDILTPN